MYKPEEGSILPKKLHKTLETEHFGCLALKFSNSGRFLAFSCTKENYITFIQVYDLEDDILHCCFYLHQKLIHDLNWSPNDQFLVSASADRTIKLFELPEYRV